MSCFLSHQFKGHCTQNIRPFFLTYIHSCLAMLAVILTQHQNTHIQTSQTQEGPALPRQLRFCILSGSCTCMQPICVSDTHVSFLMHPQGWPQQHGLQAFFFFPTAEKNIVMAKKKKYLMSVCFGYGRGNVGDEVVMVLGGRIQGRGRAMALALCCMKYLQLPHP